MVTELNEKLITHLVTFRYIFLVFKKIFFVFEKYTFRSDHTTTLQVV